MTEPLTHTSENSKPKIVFVVPTLNEEAGIGLVLDGIGKIMRGNNDHTVLVVDGHSEDKTIQIAKERGASIVIQRESGYGDALMTGFSCACQELKADVIVMMDADGTYDPEDIPELLNPILENRADLVVGNRFGGIRRGSMTLVNKIGNRILSWVARKLLDVRIADTQCGLRAMRSDLIRHLCLRTGGMSLATEMLIEARQAKARVIEVPITYNPRLGDSKLSPVRDGMRIVATILRLVRDYKPLLFFGGAGLILSSLGLLTGVMILFEWLRTGVIGHPAVVSLSSLLIMSGFLTFLIGLLADMIKELRRELRAHTNI